MSGDNPYSVPGFQFGADTGISLIHSDSHSIHPSQHIQVQHHLGQVSSQISHSQSTMPPQNPMTRLKVEDALSYLDLVKQQFSSTPSVYNDFLDIMKKFKAQSIDTPGVISQVSSLFNGHPELMVGFNAFLPMGYKVPGGKSEAAPYSPEQKLCAVLSAFEPQHPRQSPRVLGDSMVETTSVGEQGRLGGMGGGQPVEFNHAINYVNKIKLRYQNKPEVYKNFLEILHVYQNEQKQSKECSGLGTAKTTSETDVYNRVSLLFKDEPDLLSEFSQFLPDAGGSSFMAGVNFGPQPSLALNESDNPLSLCGTTSNRKPSTTSSVSTKPTSANLKAANRHRLSSSGSFAPPPARKFKSDSGRDVMPDYYNLLDFALFDKIHKALGDADYNKFLKVLNMYCVPELHMTSAELMQLIQPFTQAMPDLKKVIKDMLKQKDDPQDVASASSQMKEKTAVDQTSTIDYTSCKIVGQSYRTLPRDQVQPTCSGRTELCRQVLNDVYVSCPSWSEDSSSVIKKLGAEEQIFRCEEDRFQFDIVIANFEAAIHALTCINRKLTSVPEEDITKRYTETLFSAFSESLFRIVIRRLYATEGLQVFEAMKKNPLVVIPIVLSRLEAKADEWRRAKERNSKNWNELNQKYYLKSLDHQGVNFKQTDTKQLRSKALIQELTNIYDDRVAKKMPLYPNMELVYHGEKCMNDATLLIIHHVKRQTSIHQDEKQKIKQLLKHFIPDLFYLPRGELSDDELNEEMETENGGRLVSQKLETVAEALNQRDRESRKSLQANVSVSEENGCNQLLFGNHYWYVFIRLYLILCDRLNQFYEHSEQAIEENQRERKKAETSVAVSLGYRTPPPVEPEKSYGFFLEMVKSYLDGNLETSNYEEQLRDLFTIHAYVAYTMDKLIQAIVRQLQYLVTDNVSIQLMDYCSVERTSDYSYRMLGRLNESAYQHRAEQLMPGENYYKIVVIKKRHLVLIDHIPMKNEGTAEDGEKANGGWNQYAENFAVSDEPVSADCLRHMKEFPVFLRRHLGLNKTERSMSKVEDAARACSDEIANAVDLSVCRLYVNPVPNVYTSNPNNFLYQSSAQMPLEQKMKKSEVVRQKRVERFASALNRGQTIPSDTNWFLSQSQRETLNPFPHHGFCTNCCSQ